MYDGLTGHYTFSCPVVGHVQVRLSAFRSLERLPGASHPAVYQVVFACSCGGEHEGLVTHEDLDWAPLGAVGGGVLQPDDGSGRVGNRMTSSTSPRGRSGRVTGHGPSSAIRRTARSPFSLLPFSSSRRPPTRSGSPSAVRSASARPSISSAAHTWISRSTTTATFRWSNTSSSATGTIASPPSGKSSIQAHSTCGAVIWLRRRGWQAQYSVVDFTDPSSKALQTGTGREHHAQHINRAG